MDISNKWLTRELCFEYEELEEYSEKDLKKYYNWVRSLFKKEIKKVWDIKKNTLWATRFYIAIKYIYSATILTSSLQYAEENNLQIVIPYLTYYSLLTCSRAMILTRPDSLESLDSIRKITHTKIINIASDIIEKLNTEKSKDFKHIIDICKINRELFSYDFPGSGLSILKDTKGTTDKFYDYCKLLCELAQLNSTILEIELNINKVNGTISKENFDINDEICEDFMNCFVYGENEKTIDWEDAYRASYIKRKIKQPLNLRAMMTDGMTDDFIGNYCSKKEEKKNDYNPDHNWHILFPLP